MLTVEHVLWWSKVIHHGIPKKKVKWYTHTQSIGRYRRDGTHGSSLRWIKYTFRRLTKKSIGEMLAHAHQPSTPSITERVSTTTEEEKLHTVAAPANTQVLTHAILSVWAALSRARGHAQTRLTQAQPHSVKLPQPCTPAGLSALIWGSSPLLVGQTGKDGPEQKSPLFTGDLWKIVEDHKL